MLTARSLLSEPSRSLTRAVARPKPLRLARDLDGDELAVVRIAASRLAGWLSSRPSCFLSIGSSRPPPSGSARKTPSTRALARSMILMTRPV